MTPDELPADMEGLINNVALPWIEATEMSADPEDLAKAGQAVRALLKAYQEQRRALEDLIDHAEQCAVHLDYHDACMMGDEPVQAARAALNQKGDER